MPAWRRKFAQSRGNRDVTRSRGSHMNDFWRFLIGLVKLTLFVGVVVTFYAFQAIYNPAIRSDVKSAAETIVVIAEEHEMFMAIYGGYDIGKKSKKNVQNSAIINTWLTDLIVFAWICATTKVITSGSMFLSCFGMFLFSIAVQGVLALALVLLGFNIY